MAESLESATLRAERQRASFDVPRMAACWNGSPEAVALAAEAAERLAALGPLYDRKENYKLGKYDRYVRTAARVADFTARLRPGAELAALSDAQRWALYRAAFPVGNNVDIHEGMFTPTIRLQGSEEQQKLWLPACESRAILGSYCQTEIGHGSDVAGLETQATFDQGAGEFELQTPNVRATKWWPKGVGRTVTHAVVYARLRLPQPDGSVTDKGVKAFLVQLRDLETGENLPGIRSGDIGPTIGAVESEQGWVAFDRVRLPRSALLCRYGEVLPDGSYAERGGRGTAKRGYSTMMKVRSEFAFMSAQYLAQACAVAVRYCAVRRQFPKPGVAREDMQVLDYQSVQVRTLPWVATAYALRFTGRKMLRLYYEAERRVSAGDSSQLAEAHALSSGLKAATTKLAADGIEELRRACGGHGYLVASGLVEHYGDAMLMFTGEGENYMIVQQLTRWLLKGQFSGDGSWAGFLKQRDDAAEGKRCKVAEQKDWLQPEVQLAALQHRARRRVQDITAQASKAMAAGKSGADAARAVQWDGIQASFAVADALMASAFVEEVARAEESLRPALGSLCSLFCLSLLERSLSDLLMDGYATPVQCSLLRDEARSLLDVVRPDAVALVDSFAFSDNDLNSALGSYDGDVYNRLLQWAAEEPMNEGAVIRGWQEHWAPMLRAGREQLEKTTGQGLQGRGLVQGRGASATSRL